jgi:hypothetical protein
MVQNTESKHTVFYSKNTPLSEKKYIDPFRDFISRWNQFTQSDEDPTYFMKEQFNTIQTFHNEPLVGLAGEDFSGIRLLYRDSFVKALEILSVQGNSKKFCNLYERYLESTGEIELPSKRKGLAKGRGLNPFLIRIDTSDLDLDGEINFIINSRGSGLKLGTPQFNPWGYHHRIFYPKKSSTAFNLLCYLMKEVKIEDELLNNIIQDIKKNT